MVSEKIITILAIIAFVMVASLMVIGYNIYHKQPECYLTNEGCNFPYDQEEMFFDSNSLIQCCKKPHYMLQGINVIDYCLEFKREIIDKNITQLSKY